MRPVSETEFYVDAYGASIAFKRDRMGVVTDFEYRDIRAPKVEPFTPNKDDLMAFQGTYFSEELEATYTLSLKDGTLIAQHRRHDDATLSPTTPDTFTTTHWFMASVRFTRDRSRQITGFEATHSRSRNVRFDKVQ